MFQKTAASFDECSTAGVFLSTLHCPDYRSELLFPADIQTLSSGEPPELPDLGWVEMTDLKAALQQCAEDRQICPSLAGFQFTKWDSEAHNESVSALVDKFKKKDQVFDLDAEVEDSDCEDFPTGPWRMTSMPMMKQTRLKLGIAPSSGAGRSPARFKAAKTK